MHISGLKTQPGKKLKPLVQEALIQIRVGEDEE